LYQDDACDEQFFELDLDVSASTHVKFSILLEEVDIPHLTLLGQYPMKIGRKGLDFIGQPGSTEHIDCPFGDANVWVYVDTLEPYEAREIALSFFYDNES